jgi:hypothetical protein
MANPISLIVDQALSASAAISLTKIWNLYFYQLNPAIH